MVRKTHPTVPLGRAKWAGSKDCLLKSRDNRRQQAIHLLHSALKIGL